MTSLNERSINFNSSLNKNFESVVLIKEGGLFLYNYCKVKKR